MRIYGITHQRGMPNRQKGRTKAGYDRIVNEQQEQGKIPVKALSPLKQVLRKDVEPIILVPEFWFSFQCWFWSSIRGMLRMTLPSIGFLVPNNSVSSEYY